MKNILLICSIILLACTGSLNAQWTTDPTAPTVVAAETGSQNSVQSFNDGNNGLYVFWLDTRAGNKDIYGQHYNATGQAQWAEGGVEFANFEGQVNSFTVLRNSDGSIILAWTVISSTDAAEKGAYVKKIDADGNDVWSGDLKLRDDSAYPNSLGGIRLVKSGADYYVGTSGTLIGGSNQIRISKFDESGSLLWPYGGTVPTGTGSFGSYSMTTDESGGIYVYYSGGNGAGAALYCNHIAGVDDLQTFWASWVNITAGSQGLGYQYSGIGDAGGITFVWVGNGPVGSSTNIYARRYEINSGTQAWNSNTIDLCVADGSQDKFYWKKSGNNYYITWADGRPGVVGNAAIYAHKFTINGVVLWAENGVEAANLNTYIPYPEFDLDEDNTMCIAHLHSGSGLKGHKVKDDATVVWGPGGALIFNTSYSPFYEDFNIVYTGDRFVAVSAKSASGGGADNIYLNEIKLPPVEVTENVTACNSYTAYNQTFTATDAYVIELTDTVVTLNLTIVNNMADVTVAENEITTVNSGVYSWYDCNQGQLIDGETGPVYSATETGSYALILSNGECTDTSTCIPISFASIDEILNDIKLEVYPNPAVSEIFVSGNPALMQNSVIEIIDLSGKLVYTKNNIQAFPLRVDVSDLKNGLYFIRLSGGKEIQKIPFLKSK
ncbi:MAG: T9SS type A sorting domain-containing protein [Bacteroidetes bacterium]|nr:T9SS type A sorting domain-containing protein [Bacteroidota bacterium]